MKFTKPNKKNVNRIIKFLGKGAIVWLIRMRQVCILPDILSNSFKKIEEEGFIDPASGIGSINSDEMKDEIKNIITTSLKSSSKINEVINKILTQPRKERKIIFCHYRQEIDIIKKF